MNIYNLNDVIYKRFIDNFTAHNNAVSLLLGSWYFLKEVFFREILSWKYFEIYPEEIDKLDYSLNDSKSELVPVVVMTNSKTNDSSAIWMELHIDWNVF